TPASRPRMPWSAPWCAQLSREWLATELAQPVQRLALELPAALLTDLQPCCDFRVCLGWLAEQAVASYQDLAVPRREEPEQGPHLPARLLLVEVKPGVGRSGVRNQIAQRRAVLADLLVERSGHSRRATKCAHAADAEPGALGDGLGGREARAELPELFLGARDRSQLVPGPRGDANRSRIAHSFGNGAADPPDRVRRELQPAAPIEPFDRPHEPDVSLLHEILEGHAEAEVPARNGPDKALVGLDHLAACGRGHAAARSGGRAGSASAAAAWVKWSRAGEGVSSRLISSKSTKRSGSSGRATIFP